MKTWFLSLQERERLILLGGAAAAVLVILWAFVLNPLGNETADLRESVTQKQQLLIDLGRVEGMRAEDPSAQAGGAEQSLVVLVTSTAQPFGLALDRTRPDGADGIQVTFQGVSFDSLLSWLISLDTTHGVTVDAASFTSARDRGLVNGQLTLRRT